jgi:hypothetical protein
MLAFIYTTLFLRKYILGRADLVRILKTVFFNKIPKITIIERQSK